MKQYITFLLLLAGVFSFAQIKWMSLSEAQLAQKSQQKKIIIFFETDWCENCKAMENSTFLHPVIQQAFNDNYLAVKFNAEGNETVNIFGRSFTNPKYVEGKKHNSMHDFTTYMNVIATPSFAFLDEFGNTITLLQGRMTEKELEPYLVFFSKDDYKKITTKKDWEAYQKKFKSSIKD